MAFDPAFLNDMRALRDEVMGELADDGFVLAAEPSVALVQVTYTLPNPAAEDPGTPFEVVTAIEPRPTVKLKAVWRSLEGVTVKLADATVAVSRQVPEADLLGAAWWEIDGEKYDLIGGGLKARPLVWEALLLRRQGG